VFKKDGTYVKEAFPELSAHGSITDIGFSADSAQRYLYVMNCISHRIDILVRDTLTKVGTIGGPGRMSGRFYLPHSFAVDSQGTLYTGETSESKRLQRFVLEGSRPSQ
jgi:hypothetical protein